MSGDDPGLRADDEGSGDDAFVDALAAVTRARSPRWSTATNGTMLRVARMHVATREAAEDVVQETFHGVIRA
jgi:hypothetical protein